MEQFELDFIGEIPIGPVVIKERTIQEKFITVDGQEFLVNDLYETLENLDCRDIWFPYDERNNKDVLMFLKFDVIRDCGSRYSPAEKGKNFDAFFDAVSKMVFG